MAYQIGTKDKLMVLKTPPLTSEYTMHVDRKDGSNELVCTVGKTFLLYNINCLDDLHEMLKSMVIGWNSEVSTDKSPQKTEPLKHGAVPKRIL